MTFQEYKKNRMRDQAFAEEYKKIEPEMKAICALIDARLSQNLSQKELSERTGIAQAEISRLESGQRNPSLKILQRLADGMNMNLTISFTPKR